MIFQEKIYYHYHNPNVSYAFGAVGINPMNGPDAYLPTTCRQTENKNTFVSSISRLSLSYLMSSKLSGNIQVIGNKQVRWPSG